MHPPLPPAQVTGSLTSILLTVYLPDIPLISTALNKPMESFVDWSGRCFETGEKLKVGWVCNTCLCVFGEEGIKGRKECKACGEKVKSVE